MLKWCILCFGCLILQTFSAAQNVSTDRKARQGYEEAMQLYRSKRYGEALKVLDKAAVVCRTFLPESRHI